MKSFFFIVKTKMILEIFCALLCLYAGVKILWYWVVHPWEHFPKVPMCYVPFFGHILGLINFDEVDFHEAHLKWLNKNESVILWVFNRGIVFKDRNAIEKLLISNQEITKSDNYWIFHDVIGHNSLFTGTGDSWRKRRKMLTPSFHFNILSDFLVVMEKHTKQLVSHLKDGNLEGEKTFNAIQEMKSHSFGILLETSMGIQCGTAESGYDQAKIWEMAQGVDRIFELMIWRDKVPWYRPKWLFQWFKDGKEFYSRLNSFKQFSKSMVEKRVEQLRIEQTDSSKKQAIFLDTLLVNMNNDEFVVEDIMNETHTFLIAGYDTVATELVWCLFMLGLNQDKQAKAFEECAHVNKLGLSVHETVKELKYLECVVKEVMRLHPSAPAFSRVLQEDMVVNSTRYPKGTTFCMCILALQQDPRYWDEPLKFKPERFLTEENENKDRNPFTYIPFSAGPRNCIGQKFAMMEMKITLYHILLNFEVVSLQKEEEIKATSGIFHIPANKEGLLVQFKPRHTPVSVSR
ncbi:cytochrome P450 4V2-like [Clytia hemisphaerica]